MKCFLHHKDEYITVENIKLPRHKIYKVYMTDKGFKLILFALTGAVVKRIKNKIKYFWYSYTEELK